jgi:hypothetical protein
MKAVDARWLYLMPLIHLVACLTIWIARLESGVHYLIYFDFPFSFILVILGWRNDDFLIWFATLGTVWWYGLSYVALRAVGRPSKRRW